MKLSETLRRPDTNVAPANSASDMRQGLLINAAAGGAKSCSATRDAGPGVERLAPADSASGSGDGARSGKGKGVGWLAWAAASHYGLVAFATAVAQEIFVLWAKLPSERDGLGWAPFEIGAVQSSGGAGLLLASLLLFPRLSKRLGMRRLALVSWVVPVLCWAAIPFTNTLRSDSLVVVNVVLRVFPSICTSFLYSCSFTMISFSVPRAKLGAANGALAPPIPPTPAASLM